MKEFSAGQFDIAVIGAGHAGIEAALAAARLGLETVCFTINLDAVGNMPCNPAIGGTGKGHLVRELDALGGEMAKAADRACIQYRMLNRGKGPAVWSLRAQADRREYQKIMKHTLEGCTPQPRWAMHCGHWDCRCGGSRPARHPGSTPALWTSPKWRSSGATPLPCPSALRQRSRRKTGRCVI